MDFPLKTKNIKQCKCPKCQYDYIDKYFSMVNSITKHY